MNRDAFDVSVWKWGCPSKTDVSSAGGFECAGDEAFAGPNMEPDGRSGQTGVTQFRMVFFDAQDFGAARFEIACENGWQAGGHVFAGRASKLGSVLAGNVLLGREMGASSNVLFDRNSFDTGDGTREVHERLDIVKRRGKENGIMKKTLDVGNADLCEHRRQTSREAFYDVFDISGVDRAAYTKRTFAKLVAMSRRDERPRVRFHGSGA